MVTTLFFFWLQKTFKAIAESNRSLGSRKQVKEKGWKRILKVKGMWFGGGRCLSSLAIKADKKQNPDFSLLAQSAGINTWPGNSACTSPCLCCCSWRMTPAWKSLLLPLCLRWCWREMFFGIWLPPDTMLLRSLLMPRQSKVEMSNMKHSNTYFKKRRNKTRPT